MKKLLFLLLFCLLLCACSGKPVPPASDAPERMAEEISAGVVFSYNGKEYDLREREINVNALTGATQVGNFLVAEGHINPKNAYYGIFDTEKEAFVKDIIGTNLTWRDDDISTAVYSFWSEIYDYDGNLLGNLELADDEYICGLAWTDSRSLSVEIYSGIGKRTVALDVPLS